MSKKSLTLFRVSKSEIVTQGVLINDETGLPICLTLEEPWKNNAQGVSCIPAGEYIVVPHVNSKGSPVFLITNVKSRTAIQIHIGNTTKDIEGCVLVGTEFGAYVGLPAVLGSQRAFHALSKSVGHDPFILKIVEVNKNADK